MISSSRKFPQRPVTLERSTSDQTNGASSSHSSPGPGSAGGTAPGPPPPSGAILSLSAPGHTLLGSIPRANSVGSDLRQSVTMRAEGGNGIGPRVLPFALLNPLPHSTPRGLQLQQGSTPRSAAIAAGTPRRRGFSDGSETCRSFRSLHQQLGSIPSMRSLHSGASTANLPGAVPIRGSLVLLRDVVPSDIIGRGRSVVYRGTWEGTTPVAMKSVIRISTKATSSDVRETVTKEAALISRLRHPRIVQLFGVCVHEGTLYLVTELAQGCLLALLRNKGVRPEELVGAAMDVAAGMNYLAQNGIVHRELACRSILYERDGPDGSLVAKVSDFGITRVQMSFRDDGSEISHTEMQAMLPIRWMAPETFENYYSEKSDVWSFGVVLWEMFTNGATPWEWASNIKVCEMIQKGTHLPRPSTCTPQLFELFEKCWEMSPEKRPSFRELFQELKEFAPQQPQTVAVPVPRMSQVTLDVTRVESYSEPPKPAHGAASSAVQAPATVNEDATVSWVLDKKDCIVCVTPVFQGDQHPLAGSKDVSRPEGKPINKLVVSQTTQSLYKSIISYVRSTQKRFTFMYWVDWNGKRRHCEMRIAPLVLGSISLTSRVIRSTAIPEMPTGVVPQKLTSLSTCCFCNRVSPDGETWQNDKDTPRKFTILTCCQNCFDDISDKISAS